MELIQWLKKLLPAGGFARGATILVSGTAVGQGLVMLSSPVLTRLYTREEFGILAVYGAIVAIVTLISSLRYEVAVPLPERERGGVDLLVLSILIVICFALVSMVGVLILGDRIAVWTGTPGLAAYLWLMPIGILLGGLNKALTYWALRKKAFRVLGIVRVQKGIGMAVSQMALGYFRFGALGLILGHILGVAGGLIRLIRHTARTSWKLLTSTRPAGLWAGALRYQRFPKYSVWSDLANVAGTQLPFIILSGIYSATVAGMYMLAHRVALAPVALVAEATGKVFMANAVGARREGALPALTFGVFRFLLRAGLGPLAIVSVVAPELFAIIFGTDWRGAGEYLQYIITWIGAVFVFAPLTTLYAVLERQDVEFRFQVTLLATRLGFLAIGAFFGGVAMAICLYATSAALVYLGFGCWLLGAAGVSASRVIREILAEVSVAGFGAAALALIGWVGAGVLSVHKVTVGLVVLVIGLAFIVLFLLRARAALRNVKTGAVGATSSVSETNEYDTKPEQKRNDRGMQ